MQGMEPNSVWYQRISRLRSEICSAEEEIRLAEQHLNATRIHLEMHQEWLDRYEKEHPEEAEAVTRGKYQRYGRRRVAGGTTPTESQKP